MSGAGLVEALRLGVEMRTAQKTYYRASRNSSEKLDAMRKSIALETRFDKAAGEALAAIAAEEEPT